MTADSRAGPQAWVDAYHDTHQSPAIESLPLKSGALQGAVVIDYPFDHRFESLHIVYDGINGQLPNLDLLNTVVAIASGQMGIGASLQQMWQHTDSYQDRLKTMLRGMLNQGLGHASGPHSSFIPYHVDAITLQPYGDGWQDEMAMGRVIESTFRSLNNLLEHLHQSFFFYLLMQANRFVSIGTYLPSAMLVACNFTIMAIFLWVKSGSPLSSKSKVGSTTQSGEKPPPLVMVQEGDAKALVPEEALAVRERELFLPLAVVAGSQFLGVLPLYLFNHTPAPVSLSTPFLRTQLIPPDAPLNLHPFHSPQHHHPTPSFPPPHHNLPPNLPTILAHKILLPPPPRPLPFLTRHPQLLARLPRRYIFSAPDLHATAAQPFHHRGHLGVAVDGVGADYGVVRWCPVLGTGDWGGVEGGGVWVGCLGDEYTGCGVVCVVAWYVLFSFWNFNSAKGSWQGATSGAWSLYFSSKIPPCS